MDNDVSVKCLAAGCSTVFKPRAVGKRIEKHFCSTPCRLAYHTIRMQRARELLKISEAQAALH